MLRNMFFGDIKFYRRLCAGCKKMADIMYAGTMALGCKPYRDSQKNACECPALPGFKTDL